MANVYTDLAKWDDDWYLSLTPKFKCAWQYLCDGVDGCGVLKLSMAKLSFCVGETVDSGEFNRIFSDRIVYLKNDEIWVPGTLSRIYRTLSPKIPAHANAARKIIRVTERAELNDRGLRARERFQIFLSSFEAPDQALTSASPGPALKEKGEKNKDKREKTKGESEGKTIFDFESAYEIFPRHEGKGPGLKRIAKQVGGNAEKFEQFTKACSHYAALCDRRNTLPDKIKMFSSFVGNDRDGFPWIEYIERPRELDQTPRVGPSGIVRAPLRAPPTEAVKLDGCIGETTEVGPRTLSYADILNMRKNIGGNQGAS